MIFVRSAFGGFGNSFIKIKGAFKFKMLNFERSKAKLFEIKFSISKTLFFYHLHFA